jgi:hypothetical protein
MSFAWRKGQVKEENMSCETSSFHHEAEGDRKAVAEYPTVKRHPNSARFHEILKEAGELHDKKQMDYGRGQDPFANVNASAEFGVKPWIGAYIRLNDKITRIKSFIEKGNLVNESLEDSLRDVIVYAAIALVLYEQENK